MYDAIDDAIDITGYQQWYQWCHITKEVMLHLIFAVLT